MQAAFIIIVVAVIVMMVCIFLPSSNNQDAEAKKMNDALASLIDFNVTKSVTNGTLFNFSIDEDKQEIFCYANSKHVRFKYSDIVIAEILIDGDVTVTNKSVSLGGALAGAFIGGKLGAVVAGSSLGNVTSTKQVSSIDVHILLRNNDVDSFDIPCLDPLKAPVETNVSYYHSALSDAQKIFDMIRIAMDEIKCETALPAYIEELKELAELKKQGIITEEEFATLKAKIMTNMVPCD